MYLPSRSYSVLYNQESLGPSALRWRDGGQGLWPSQSGWPQVRKVKYSESIWLTPFIPGGKLLGPLSRPVYTLVLTGWLQWRVSPPQIPQLRQLSSFYIICWISLKLAAACPAVLRFARHPELKAESAYCRPLGLLVLEPPVGRSIITSVACDSAKLFLHILVY